MKLLIAHSPLTLKRVFGDAAYHAHMGLLASPQRWHEPDARAELAADNDCFQALDEVAFVAMLERLKAFPFCRFVSAPDFVADARATAERFERWEPAIHAAGLPVALVAQDGLEALRVPWRHFEALFIGGSTEWKLSASAAAIAREAKRRGKWLHMGRCNSNRRLHYARSIGCDSADGTGYARFSKSAIPPAIPALLSHTVRLEGF